MLVDEGAAQYRLHEAEADAGLVPAPHVAGNEVCRGELFQSRQIAGRQHRNALRTGIARAQEQVVGDHLGFVGFSHAQQLLNPPVIEPIVGVEKGEPLAPRLRSSPRGASPQSGRRAARLAGREAANPARLTRPGLAFQEIRIQAGQKGCRLIQPQAHPREAFADSRRPGRTPG